MSGITNADLESMSAGAEVVAGETGYWVQYQSWEHSPMFEGAPDAWWTCSPSFPTAEAALAADPARDKAHGGFTSYRSRRVVAVTTFTVTRTIG